MNREEFLDGRVVLHHGDSRDVLKGLPDNSIDSVCTDPPYALVSIVKRFGGANAAPAQGDVYARASAGFMGQTWDTGETAFAAEFWAEVLRVLKPGGWLIAASGTRTYHRLACAIEDAGFEIRDMVSWLYGSGFPKSHRPIQGMYALPRWLTRAQWKQFHRTARVMSGSALKPACEPWVLARKPLCGTIASNVCQYGTGALNIDGCRIDGAKPDTTRGASTTGLAMRGTLGGQGRILDDGRGRWPANVIHDGSAEVVSAFPETSSGLMKAGTRRAAQDRAGSVVYGVYGGDATTADTPGDAGSAARFFYSAKANTLDRLGTKHPTVKPVDLMRYFARLITPPGGVVLDPFAGSGTTGEAAWREGFRAILIEREAEYVADIAERLRLAGAGEHTRRRASARNKAKPIEGMGGLFA
jgi:site-specific DNA-methyltransferase (adenine-specific)